ncbi:MAG TPA: TIGR03067 domain-containing protein [Pirellulaceae bacterium]|nr:TIGR03067 domain-containing protein [Pirellulaceae bacterium]
MTGVLLLITAIAGVIPNDAIKAEEAKFHGDWEVVEMDRGGRKFPRDYLEKSSFVIKEGVIITTDGDGDEQKARFKVDPSKKPKTIELSVLDAFGRERPNAAPVLGIYEFDGDTLKLAWRKGGGARPEDFEPVQDDRQLVRTTLKKKGK